MIANSSLCVCTQMIGSEFVIRWCCVGVPPQCFTILRLIKPISWGPSLLQFTLEVPPWAVPMSTISDRLPYIAIHPSIYPSCIFQSHCLSNWTSLLTQSLSATTTWTKFLSAWLPLRRVYLLYRLNRAFIWPTASTYHLSARRLNQSLYPPNHLYRGFICLTTSTEPFSTELPLQLLYPLNRLNRGWSHFSLLVAAT